jgi:hypothetical protein
VPSARALTPEAVVATARYEVEPAAAEGYLAFSRDVAGHPNRANLIVRHSPDPDVRINPAGTNAFAGSIDGTTLTFWQHPTKGRRGNIRFYDLVGKTYSAPAGVNTKRHETQPHLSGDWLLFARSYRVALSSPRRILLRDLVTSEQRLLDFGDDAYVQAGGLAGNYAAWTRCARLTRCRTWLYDITGPSVTLLPNPLARSQFAASVTADGTVYYAESGTILCSDRKVVRFYRQPLSGERELLATLPRGRDTAVTSPVVNGDGSIDVFFDRFNPTCTRSDIYKFQVPAPTP